MEGLGIDMQAFSLDPDDPDAPDNPVDGVNDDDDMEEIGKKRGSSG